MGAPLRRRLEGRRGRLIELRVTEQELFARIGRLEVENSALRDEVAASRERITELSLELAAAGDPDAAAAAVRT